MIRWRNGLFVAAVAVGLLLASGVLVEPSASAEEPEGQLNVVPGSYIVVLTDGTNSADFANKQG